MSKKVNAVIWIIAIFAIMATAYTFYSKNKPQGLAMPPVQNNEQDQASQESKQTAPDFSLKDLDGKTVKLSDYKGKVVILNFWAVWCKYCKQEMPDLNELNKELEKGNEAVILAVDVQESPDTVRSYLSSNGINLRVVLDQDGSVTGKYGVSGFPTTFIINKDGTVFTNIPGATNKETLTEILANLQTS